MRVGGHSSAGIESLLRASKAPWSDREFLGAEQCDRTLHIAEAAARQMRGSRPVSLEMAILTSQMAVVATRVSGLHLRAVTGLRAASPRPAARLLFACHRSHKLRQRSIAGCLGHPFGGKRFLRAREGEIEGHSTLVRLMNIPTETCGFFTSSNSNDELSHLPNTAQPVDRFHREDRYPQNEGLFIAASGSKLGDRLGAS
jgi:hypothetical protein